MRVRVLGPVDVLDDTEQPIPIGSRSQRLVLAVLAAEAGRTVSADRLVDALWGDDPPPSALGTLRTYVSRLRQVLKESIDIRPGGYALTLPVDQVDATRFERLVQRAAATGAAASVELLDEAVSLWGGPAFGDLAGEMSLRPSAVRLEELRQAARESRATALLAAGRVAEAAAAAEELLAEHPLREGAWAALIDALTAGHRVPEALRAYRRARAVLAEAGLEPSERLRRAEAAAFAGQEPVLAARQVRVPASSLVGREQDLEAIARLLASARVVTLIGPGGVGKTRLALEAARRMAAGYEWGVRLAELSRIDDPRAVAASVVDAIGLAVEGGSAEATLARAGGLDVLVVLDNCEHVVDQAAAVAEALVSGGPRVRIVATSRERLGVDGEQVWPVTPLAFGATESPARRLFLDRARAVRPDLDLSETTVAAIDRIVARLDGLPLAIEMAAARAATLPVPELAAWVEREIDTLRSDRRTGEARHRTLAAVVEWSEVLLSEEERAVFAELSVFSGMIEPSDAAAVTGRPGVLDTLCRLADRSLVVADTQGARARFGMLATVRNHAARRLAASGRAAALARRHAEHVAAQIAFADQALRTRDEGAAHARLDGLITEVRVAHRWARTHDMGLAARLSAGLHLFAQSRLRDEPLAWAAALVAERLDAVPPEVAAAVFASAAQRAVNTGDLRRARRLAERGVAAAGATAPSTYPLEILSDVCLYEGQLQASVDAAQEELLASQRSGDRHYEVAARVGMALPLAYAGRYDKAEQVLELDIDEHELAPSDRGWLAYGLGEVVLDRDPRRALAALDHAVALADSVGNRYLGGVARVSACSLRARAGDIDEAVAAFAGVIEHWRAQRALKHQLTTLRNLVVLLERMEALPEAAELLGTVQAETVAPTYGAEAARLADVRAQAVAALGHEEARRRLATGAARTVDEAAQVAVGWLTSPPSVYRR